MLKNILTKAFFIILVAGCFHTTEAQIFKKKDKNSEETDSKGKPKNGKIESYEKVITKEAKSDKGLFDVHVVGDNHYYEIPDSLFNKEMLMVSRISKTAKGIGFGGGKINTKVLKWERLPKKVLLRVVSYDIVAADSLPVSEAVLNSNFEPVLYSFDIKALKKDSIKPATIIQVNDLFEKDINALGMPAPYRKEYKVSRLDESRSYITTLKS